MQKVNNLYISAYIIKIQPESEYKLQNMCGEETKIKNNS